MSEESKKTFWQHVTGWGVVAFVSALSLGSGVSMTSSHPYIADTFFFVGFACLLVKFWAWEEAKHDTHRKTAILLAGVTVLVILLFGGSCWLSYYLNLPKPKADESASNPQQAPKHIENSKTIEAPQDVPPSLTASMRPLHHHVVPKSSSEPSSNPQTESPPTYGGQTCIGSACAQGQGSQATLNKYGSSQPPPNLRRVSSEPRLGDRQREPLEGSFAGNPGMTVGFTMDDQFTNPSFLVRCDHPCIPTIVAWANSAQLNWQVIPDKIGGIITPGTNLPIPENVLVTIWVRSRDQTEITSVTVEGYARPAK